jgi:predicted DNA-binding transcriptional regulator AlpA
LGYLLLQRKEASMPELKRTSSELTELLPITPLCDWLHCNKSSVYRRMAKGIIPPPIKVGGSSLWVKSEVEAALAKMREARHG